MLAYSAAWLAIDDPSHGWAKSPLDQVAEQGRQLPASLMMVEPSGRPGARTRAHGEVAVRAAYPLGGVLEGWARSRSKHEVMKALASRGVVCGAVLDTVEVLANPHLRERGVVYDIDHPTRGRFSVIGCPVRLSDSPFAPTRAPLMGEHTETVLTSLGGFSADEVRALREKRVI